MADMAMKLMRCPSCGLEVSNQYRPHLQAFWGWHLVNAHPEQAEALKPTLDALVWIFEQAAQINEALSGFTPPAIADLDVEFRNVRFTPRAEDEPTPPDRTAPPACTDT